MKAPNVRSEWAHALLLLAALAFLWGCGVPEMGQVRGGMNREMRLIAEASLTDGAAHTSREEGGIK